MNWHHIKHLLGGAGVGVLVLIGLLALVLVIILITGLVDHHRAKKAWRDNP